MCRVLKVSKSGYPAWRSRSESIGAKTDRELGRVIRRLHVDSNGVYGSLLGSSVSYWIAVGPLQGQKAFMIRTIQPLNRPDPGLERVARAHGFSLHAGVNCEGHQKDKRERLCRYIARPAVAAPRLSLSSTGKVVYTLKTPYRDGTTQVAFERGGHPPVDFMGPKPRVKITGTPSPVTTVSLPQITAGAGRLLRPGVARR